jgi:hypothetical protein
MPDFEAGFQIAGLIRSSASRNHSAENQTPEKAKPATKDGTMPGNFKLAIWSFPKFRPVVK